MALCIAVFDNRLIKFGTSYEGIRSLGTGVEHVYLLIGSLCLSKLKMYRHHGKPLLLKVFFLFLFILKSAFKHFALPDIWCTTTSVVAVAEFMADEMMVSELSIASEANILPVQRTLVHYFGFPG